MKKKMKIGVVIIILLIICWLTIFLIDYNRVSNLKEPMFNLSYYEEKGMVEYKGLGYTTIVKTHESAKYGTQIAQIEMYMFGKAISGTIQDFAENNEEPKESEEQMKDVVIIKNGNIQNENLIDKFIENTGIDFAEELFLKIYEYENENEYVEKEIKFIPGICAVNAKNRTLENVKIPDHNSTYEDFRDYYGYFTLYDGVKIQEYRADNWILKRRIENNRVEFCIDAALFVDLADESDIPVICTYSVSSSGYIKKFDLTYHQRRDVEVYKIYEDEIGLYTFGGNIDITIEGDMVYYLQNALYQKVISIQDIIEQAKIDIKYGVCYNYGMYQDGGSEEYFYDNYTILKYNKLDGTDDVVIGFQGSIINQVDITKAKTIRSPQNVTIEIDENTISNTEVSITITDNNEEHYGYGVEFHVEKKVNNKWEYLDYISDDLAWITIAYSLDENNRLTQKLNIENYYGKLNSGIYRIVKPVYDNGYIDIYSNEFEVK